MSTYDETLSWGRVCYPSRAARFVQESYMTNQVTVYTIYVSELWVF